MNEIIERRRRHEEADAAYYMENFNMTAQEYMEAPDDHPAFQSFASTEW